jgi:hypothetical protein
MRMLQCSFALCSTQNRTQTQGVCRDPCSAFAKASAPVSRALQGVTANAGGKRSLAELSPWLHNFSSPSGDVCHCACTTSSVLIRKIQIILKTWSTSNSPPRTPPTVRYARHTGAKDTLLCASILVITCFVEQTSFTVSTQAY